MIEKQTVYKVNGKTFEREEDAVKEDGLLIGIEYERIANKFLHVINLVNHYSEMSIQSDLCDVVINVEDKELLNQFYVTNRYADSFLSFLKHLDIKYSSFDGDERQSSYLKIHPTIVTKELPTLKQTITFIEESIRQKEAKRQSYLNKIMKR